MTKEEKRRRFWKIVIAAVVLWMFVIPVIAMTGFAFMHYRHERAMPSTKVVPNLKGLDLKSAEAKAREAGFAIDVMGHRSDLPGPFRDSRSTRTLGRRISFSQTHWRCNSRRRSG